MQYPKIRWFHPVVNVTRTRFNGHNGVERCVAQEHPNKVLQYEVVDDNGIKTWEDVPEVFE